MLRSFVVSHKHCASWPRSYNHRTFRFIQSVQLVQFLEAFRARNSSRSGSPDARRELETQLEPSHAYDLRRARDMMLSSERRGTVNSLSQPRLPRSSRGLTTVEHDPASDYYSTTRAANPFVQLRQSRNIRHKLFQRSVTNIEFCLLWNCRFH